MWTRRLTMVAKQLRAGRLEYKPLARGVRLRSAKAIISALHSRSWKRLKVGEGSKGPKMYDWASKRVVHCEAEQQPGYSDWLLARRSISKPNEIAYYLCHASAKAKLTKLARVVSQRWSIEERFRDGKQEVGLADYQLRTWTGWHRWIFLCTLALLWLMILKQGAEKMTNPRGVAEGNSAKERTRLITHFATLNFLERVTWSTAEMRRLFLIVLALPALSPVLRLSWVTCEVPDLDAARMMGSECQRSLSRAQYNKPVSDLVVEKNQKKEHCHAIENCCYCFDFIAVPFTGGVRG